VSLPKSVTPPHGFQFQVPEGRPFRLVSVETELDGDGGWVADRFFRHRIVAMPGVQQYGYHPGGKHKCLTYIKRDGSVTGGEFVFDRIDLTDADTAKGMLKAHDILRSAEKEGLIQYNPNCGGHIHMCARGYGFYDLLRLIINFGYLEEVIYRLAGAGKTYGHRTLYRGYDAANHGGGYSDPVVKGPFGEIGEAYASITGMKRMSGLNTTIYAANWCQRGTCAVEPVGQNMRHMGAGQDLKNCNCPHEKHTIEWRVWNAQGNPRILYAWLAVMQAMHAYAWRSEGDPSYKAYEMQDPLPWTWRPYSRVTAGIKHAIQERVEWMFSELPLTPEEKDALRYTFMRTPLKAFGKDWLKRRSELPYKPPPFPNVYKPEYVRKVQSPLDEPDNDPAPPEPRRRTIREQQQWLNMANAADVWRPPRERPFADLRAVPIPADIRWEPEPGGEDEPF